MVPATVAARLRPFLPSTSETPRTAGLQAPVDRGDDCSIGLYQRTTHLDAKLTRERLQMPPNAGRP